MFQKISVEKLASLCAVKVVSPEKLVAHTGNHAESLARIERTGFIASRDLKKLSSYLGVRPIKLLLPTPSNPLR